MLVHLGTKVRRLVCVASCSAVKLARGTLYQPQHKLVFANCLWGSGACGDSSMISSIALSQPALKNPMVTREIDFGQCFTGIQSYFWFFARRKTWVAFPSSNPDIQVYANAQSELYCQTPLPDSSTQGRNHIHGRNYSVPGHETDPQHRIQTRPLLLVRRPV